MSLRGKLIDIIREAAREENSPRFNQIVSRIELLTERLDALETILRSMDQCLTSLTSSSQFAAQSSEKSQEPAKPLAASRPSWPRMKRTMEEREVLNALAAKQSDLEDYWRKKSV